MNGRKLFIELDDAKRVVENETDSRMVQLSNLKRGHLSFVKVLDEIEGSQSRD